LTERGIKMALWHDAFLRIKSPPYGTCAGKGDPRRNFSCQQEINPERYCLSTNHTVICKTIGDICDTDGLQSLNIHIVDSVYVSEMKDLCELNICDDTGESRHKCELLASRLIVKYNLIALSLEQPEQPKKLNYSPVEF
jgi:hypothetical protein